MPDWLTPLMHALAMPELGLSTVFVVSFFSATLLPLGSEAVVFGLLKISPELFWPVMAVATTGNTLGGAVSWAMGLAAHRAVDKVRHKPTGHPTAPRHPRALRWLKRFGPKACLLSWLPGVGDPLCAVAGWLNLPFWPCVLYMAIGKFARYFTVTTGLLWVFPGGL